VLRAFGGVVYDPTYGTLVVFVSGFVRCCLPPRLLVAEYLYSYFLVVKVPLFVPKKIRDKKRE